MVQDCIFCKIASGAIPAEKVYEDEHVVAFNDIHPAAPTHVLVVPREHHASLDEIPEGRMDLMARIFGAVREIARTSGIAKDGYRVVVNTNRAAGQEIFHLHVHIMGGRPLGSMG